MLLQNQNLLTNFSQQDSNCQSTNPTANHYCIQILGDFTGQEA